MEKWPRWILASIAKYLRAVSGTPTMLIEHLDERTETFMNLTDRAEIRITGPYIQELGSGEYRVRLTVNILLTSRYDGPTKNAYKILDYAGIFVDAMSGSIPIYTYDSSYLEDVVVDDVVIVDNSATRILLGCLSIPLGQSIMVENYGQIDVSEKTKMTEIEAKYEMFITE